MLVCPSVSRGWQVWQAAVAKKRLYLSTRAGARVCPDPLTSVTPVSVFLTKYLLFTF